MECVEKPYSSLKALIFVPGVAGSSVRGVTRFTSPEMPCIAALAHGHRCGAGHQTHSRPLPVCGSRLRITPRLWGAVL